MNKSKIIKRLNEWKEKLGIEYVEKMYKEEKGYLDILEGGGNETPSHGERVRNLKEKVTIIKEYLDNN